MGFRQLIGSSATVQSPSWPNYRMGQITTSSGGWVPESSNYLLRMWLEPQTTSPFTCFRTQSSGQNTPLEEPHIHIHRDSNGSLCPCSWSVTGASDRSFRGREVGAKGFRRVKKWTRRSAERVGLCINYKVKLKGGIHL